MRIEKFHYYLLDEHDQPKKTGIGSTNELFNVLEGDMSYNSLGTLKSQITVKIKLSDRLNIDYNHDRIKLVIEIDGVMYPKGIYLIKTSGKNRNTIKTRFITCYSKLKLLDQFTILEPYHLPSGADVYNAICNLIGDEPKNITFTDKKLLSQYDADSNATKLQIINDLLGLINYNSLSVDDEGMFFSKPYTQPEDRESTIFYIEGEPDKTDNKNVFRNIIPDYEEECDRFNVPNIVKLYTNNIDIDPPLVAVYPIQPESGEVVTIDGEEPNVFADSVDNATDQSTLFALAKRKMSELRNVYDHKVIETAINPNHGYLDCIGLKIDDIEHNFIETSWSMKLEAGAKMRHELRRSVNVDE